MPAGVRKHDACAPPDIMRGAGRRAGSPPVRSARSTRSGMSEAGHSHGPPHEAVHILDEASGVGTRRAAAYKTCSHARYLAGGLQEAPTFAARSVTSRGRQCPARRRSVRDIDRTCGRTCRGRMHSPKQLPHRKAAGQVRSDVRCRPTDASTPRFDAAAQLTTWRGAPATIIAQ